MLKFCVTLAICRTFVQSCAGISGRFPAEAWISVILPSTAFPKPSPCSNAQTQFERQKTRVRHTILPIRTPFNGDSACFPPRSDLSEHRVRYREIETLLAGFGTATATPCTRSRCHRNDTRVQRQYPEFAMD